MADRIARQMASWEDGGQIAELPGAIDGPSTRSLRKN